VQIRTNLAGFNRYVTPPRFALPSNSCDSHMHIIGPFDRFPLRVTTMLNPPAGTAEDYCEMQARTGLARMVVVQPSSYGTDNECTLQAVEAAHGQARAVVVVDPDIGSDALKTLHRRGARGVRMQKVVAGGVSFDLLEDIAARIRPLGWHIQLFLDTPDIEELAPRLSRLDLPVVFDHMAHMNPDAGQCGPGYMALLRMLEEGIAWVKLSNAFFKASGERARDLFKANPKRAVWGSDWPHVSFSSGATPDDGQLLNDLAEWFPRAADREQILVTNADALYFK
jgi:predicted TIM-barrel fold metal-dependent hydrolase